MSVASTAPVESSTTVTLLLLVFGTQICFPSKIGNPGPFPTCTVFATEPSLFSLSRVSVPESVTHMLFPS